MNSSQVGFLYGLEVVRGIRIAITAFSIACATQATADEVMKSPWGTRVVGSSLAFSPDGKRFVTTDREHILREFETATMTVVARSKQSGYTLAIAPDFTVSMKDGEVRLQPRAKAPFRLAAEMPTNIAVSGDFKRIAVTCCKSTLCIFDAGKENPFQTIAAEMGHPIAVAFSPDGKSVATGSLRPDNRVRVWNILSGQLIATKSLLSGNVWSVAYSPDGNFLAAGSDLVADGVLIWDVKSIAGDKLPLKIEGSAPAAWSPDGKILAVQAASTHGAATLWRWPNPTKMGTFDGHVKAISHIVFSPNGKIVATVGSDNAAVLWDIDKMLAMLQPAKQ